MIRVAVMYPQSEGKSFNLEYYMNKHMKLVKEKLGSLGLVSSEVDVGISGMGYSPPPYFALGYLIFDTVEKFQAAFDKVGDELLADIPNYTNTEPVVQISDLQRL
jgi:uncharacterized protein (TIGR02118 family)